MTKRHSTEAPLASATSWPARQRPYLRRTSVEPLWHASVMDPTWPESIALASFSAKIEAIFWGNQARRDANVAQYGEPRNAYEFYHGRRKQSS